MSGTPTLDDARHTLRVHFGYPGFRAGQERAIESVLAGHDTLVVLPTGGGKSLCYQVPALILPRLTVVISPLISLMKDQVDALAARGLPATFVNSTLSGSEISERLARTRRGEIKLLYVAPERFDAGTTAERLAESGVSLLAVDEAHCISEWGHDFRPSYLRIGELRAKLGSPPVVALTATATPHVRSDIIRQLGLDRVNTIITGFDRRNLRYHVVPTRTEAEKDAALVQLLREKEGLTVVYASTRRTVERIALLLAREGIPAAAYHAGLDDEHRHEVQDAFMAERVRVIVATNAFGMGIDKPNVRLVIHYAMPGTLEAYYQEAGRAGRDGEMGNCYLLHAFPDRFTHEFFIKGAYPQRSLVEEVHGALLRLSDEQGAVNADAAAIAAGMKSKTSARDVESALRLLAEAGAWLREQPSGGSVIVRLLATPERIRRELDDRNGMEIGLLRALWRAGGRMLERGATVDLDELPPGFGGGAGASALLDALQQRQFLEWRRVSGGNRLANRGKPLASYSIDWSSLDRRRNAELAKLDAMQQYAYTKRCRRAFTLRYFGDPAARERCGGCDNCLDEHVVVRDRKASPRTSGRKSVGRASKPGALASDDESLVLSARDEAVLVKLRSLRLAIARDERLPAYVIFADRALREMAVKRPRTLQALAHVHGVGPVKLERYGERFLDVLRSADDTDAA